MMKLSQKKKEIIESAGMKFRWSFFDVVFELVRVERYEKVANERNTIMSPLRKNLQSKLFARDSDSYSSKVSSPTLSPKLKKKDEVE